MMKQLELPAKTELNIIEVLIVKALINSNVGHGEFVLVSDMRKEYHKKEKK